MIKSIVKQILALPPSAVTKLFTALYEERANTPSPRTFANKLKFLIKSKKLICIHPLLFIFYPNNGSLNQLYLCWSY